MVTLSQILLTNMDLTYHQRSNSQEKSIDILFSIYFYYITTA